jgi:hypothetical protein
MICLMSIDADNNKKKTKNYRKISLLVDQYYNVLTIKNAELG